MPIVNFYHTGATMKGVDYHDFVMLVPPALPITVPEYNYDVVCDHKTGTKIAGTVTSDGKHMIEQGNDVKEVLHQAWTVLPPHLVKQTQNQMAINKNASSKAQMSVASVSGEGTPLACCVEQAKGININCTELALLTNTVKCVSSVRTRPTKIDYYIGFQKKFIENSDIRHFIKESPGPSPENVPNLPLSERLKKYWEEIKREFGKYSQLKPSK